MQAFFLFFSSGGTYDIGEEISDGSIAMRMIKPISYNATFFQKLGNKVMTVCVLVLPMIVGVERGLKVYESAGS